MRFHVLVYLRCRLKSSLLLFLYSAYQTSVAELPPTTRMWCNIPLATWGKRWPSVRVDAVLKGRPPCGP